MQYKVPLVQNAMVSGYLAFIHLGGEVVVLLLLLNLQPNNFSAYLLRSSKSSNSSDRIAQLASKGAGVARSEDEDLEDEELEHSDSEADPSPSSLEPAEEEAEFAWCGNA